MSLYDFINNVQVHCFTNNLTKYNTGDKVNLNAKNYRYPANVMFLETIYPDKKPYTKRVHIIRNSIIEKTIEVGELKESDFENIENIFSDTGKKLNIQSYSDMISFLYEDCKLQLDLDFLTFYYKNNVELFDKRELLEKQFYEKWYI